MTAVDPLFETLFDRSRKYSFCDLCELNGFPNEKVVFEFQGLRSENEDGFIYKFSTYEYPLSAHRKIRHIHVFNRKQVRKNLQHRKSDYILFFYHLVISVVILLW
jgi:hypothetical protein